jgi:hypothetical protein
LVRAPERPVLNAVAGGGGGAGAAGFGGVEGRGGFVAEGEGGQESSGGGVVLGGVVGRGIGVDGDAHGLAPGAGAEGVDVFVLGEVDGLEEGLCEVGQGGGGFGLELASGHGGHEACENGREIARGEVVAGEAVGDVAAEGLGGTGLGFPAGVVEADVRMGRGARGAATVAVGEGEGTHVGAIGTIRRHRSLLIEFRFLSLRTVEKRGRTDRKRMKKHRSEDRSLRRKTKKKQILRAETARRGRGPRYARDYNPFVFSFVFSGEIKKPGGGWAWFSTQIEYPIDALHVKYHLG